eukprot:CAMPEP_0181224956 /NCGR_PEP_ID=MMETSP1096-20121128/31420_1 /TAXON_ID=156174 ORGANISM="Chrysochromulina ericina, Strain CCMP281" /NCGR_SAMPLE_ID=MMETSP1096 /ASSEMBLY_ACC=CAM_ASM_000453 /LENGTH=91 /DNA_ID=CAMNT_0023318107 /DNA_START=60 /DNA_END=335 /DNA_ORIENTATION=+
MTYRCPKLAHDGVRASRACPTPAHREYPYRGTLVSANPVGLYLKDTVRQRDQEPTARDQQTKVNTELLVLLPGPQMHFVRASNTIVGLSLC